MTVFERAIKKYGIEAQLDQTQEECAELIVAINHARRNRISMDALASEVADVQLMAEQMEHIVGKRRVRKARKEKLARLEVRLLEATT